MNFRAFNISHLLRFYTIMFLIFCPQKSINRRIVLAIRISFFEVEIYLFGIVKLKFICLGLCYSWERQLVSPKRAPAPRSGAGARYIDINRIVEKKCNGIPPFRALPVGRFPKFFCQGVGLTVAIFSGGVPFFEKFWGRRKKVGPKNSNLFFTPLRSIFWGALYTRFNPGGYLSKEIVLVF